MNEKIDNYWRTYQTINDWTKFSDTKAGVLVTVYGLLLTIVYANAESVFSEISTSGIILGLSLFCLLLSIFSLFYAFKCLNPRLKNPNPESVLYFGHIAQNKNYMEYFEKSNAVFDDNGNTIKQLSEQIFVNSNIAWNKFKNISVSMRFFFASIIILVLIIVTYFIQL